MVSEPVVDGVIEQATDDAPQTEAVAPTEPGTASVEADTPSGEESVAPEAVSETVVETEHPDLSWLDRDQLRELRPDILEVESNAAVQREREKLRKEAGSAEGARKASEDFLRRNGVDPSSIEDKSGLDHIRQSAEMSVTADVLSSYISEAAQNQVITSDVAESMRELAENPTPDAVQRHANKMIMGVRKAGRESAMADISLADVTAESSPTLYAEIQELRGQAASDERKAAAIEARPTSGSPPASSGQVVGNTASLSIEEYTGASAAQRREWKRDGIEVRVSA